MQRILFILLCFLPLSARPSDSIAVASPEVIHSAWHCSVEQLRRRVDIYVPQGWNDTMPVLYLIHGINGCEDAWQRQGHAIDTLEAMIADGRCRPMMLVMPDCNKWPFKENRGHGNLWKCIMRYPRLSHEHEIEYSISQLIDTIDSTYHATGPCFIAGLSDGARIAANVANVRPERVCCVGLFSPVLHKDQLPKDSTPVYTIYVGKNDMFYGSGKRFHNRLERNERSHQFIERPGGHNWRMWQRCLSDYLSRL